MPIIPPANKTKDAMLTLHVEAETFPELTRLARLALADSNAPANPSTTADTPAPAAPVKAAENADAGKADAGAPSLPVPAPRATRKKRDATTSVAPVATPAAKPDADKTSAPSSPAPAAPAAPVAAVSSTAATDFLPPVASTPPASSAPTAAKEITNDEVRYAAAELNGKYGMLVATELVQQTGTERLSLIPQEKRAAFIAACKAVQTQADADKLMAAAAERAKAKQQAKVA